MSENPFNIVCLFNFDAETYGVDGRLYENLFVLVASNVHWVQDDFRRGSAISGLETVTWLRFQGCCVVQRLGWRSFRDTTQQSGLLGHNLGRVVEYLTGIRTTRG